MAAPNFYILQPNSLPFAIELKKVDGSQSKVRVHKIYILSEIGSMVSTDHVCASALYRGEGLWLLWKLLST